MIDKKCPKCGAPFICRHNDIVRCQCAEVKLTEAAQAYIKANYNDCLCVNCLRAINQEQIGRAHV